MQLQAPEQRPVERSGAVRAQIEPTRQIAEERRADCRAELPIPFVRLAKKVRKNQAGNVAVCVVRQRRQHLRLFVDEIFLRKLLFDRVDKLLEK